MIKRVPILFLVCIMLFAAAIPLSSAHALTVTTGVISADDVAMRKTASSNGALVTRLSEGTIVKILQTNVNSEWYQVQTDTRTGYVNRMYINIDASLASYQMAYTGTIINVEQDVNVRAEPSLKGKKLGKANKGDTFKVTQAYANGAWHQIEFNGGVGYVNANYMILTAKVGNDVLSGIRRTSDLLKCGRLVLCDTCTDCLREIEQYVWDPKAGRDAVRKEHDHAMDDMRYFAATVLAARDTPLAARTVARSVR